MPDPIPTPARVLLVRPSALGDVARTVPVLASIRRAWPNARIDWLVQKGFEGAVAAHPALTANGWGGGGVVLFDRNRFGRWHSPQAQMDLLNWLRGLRASRYDVVIDAQGLLRSGLITRFTGAPVRVGFADAREGGSVGYTHRVQVPARMHTVDRMLALLPAIGVEPVKDLRLYAAADELAAAERDLGTGRYAVIAPTSRWPGKQWPDDRYIDVGRSLLETGFDRLVLVGGPGEGEQVPALTAWASQQGGRVVDLIGKTSVSRLMAVIARSSLLIGSDSAALHMAVGFARPCVALYGPTDVAAVGPAAGGATPAAPVVVLQRVNADEPLGHKSVEPGRTYMSRITTGDVIDAACCATR